MAEVEILNANGMTINKVISDDIKRVDGTAYITKETCDGLYKPKNNGAVNVKSINYTPAQEQKIQFSLTEPYTIRFAGWFVVNPDDRAAESWYISINDRPMFHSDSDGNMSVSILVYEGDIITSTTEYDRYGYLMPCESELSDWREVKSNADIWKNAVRTDGTVVDQWLNNTSSSNWNSTHGSTYRNALSYIKDDQAFDSNGERLFYVQSENIRTGYDLFQGASLISFSGDLSNLTDATYMFYVTNLESFDADLSSLEIGHSMFGGGGNRIKITEFCQNLPKLTNGDRMFDGCSYLTMFKGDLSSLTNGDYMFYRNSLESFTSDLASLTNGDGMFYGCKLNLESVQNIANTINTVSSGNITIGIQSSLQGNTDLTTALNTITSKGWRVTTQYNS